MRKFEDALSVMSPTNIFLSAGDRYLAETVKLRLEKVPVFTAPKLIVEGLIVMLETCDVSCEQRPTVEVR